MLSRTQERSHADTPLMSFLSALYSHMVGYWSEILTFYPRQFHWWSGGLLIWGLALKLALAKGILTRMRWPEARKACVRSGLVSCASDTTRARPMVPEGTGDMWSHPTQPAPALATSPPVILYTCDLNRWLLKKSPKFCPCLLFG